MILPRIAVALTLTSLAFPALAQQSPSPLESALSQKLMAEMNAGIACTTQAIIYKQQLDKANAEVTRLTDKYEKKPDESAKH